MSGFDRVRPEFRELIGVAWAMLPRKVAESVGQHFLAGLDPHFVGLHHFSPPAYVVAYGRGYDDLAHACWSYHSADGVPRVVLPVMPRVRPVSVVLHEIGHLFDEATGGTFPTYTTTDYSFNPEETFAVAFEQVIQPLSGEFQLYMQAEAFRPLRELMGLA